ncbi:MAG TPA: nuclear transport factor 2 family protein [Pseudobacter sp.]|nr:nuclear transport factor 2 family protein [Pseudobacter sp.]
MVNRIFSGLKVNNVDQHNPEKSMQRYEQLIKKFYTCFGQRDYACMNSVYHPDATFYDPVFENLNADQVKAMWEMLTKRAADLQVTVSDIQVDAKGVYGSCRWKAEYTFTGTGRKVINDVKANFKFQDDLIIEHMDEFDLWKWSRQALGFSGLLLGWSGFVQTPIRKKAKQGLRKFMEAAS